jgi:hypothetical protein
VLHKKIFHIFCLFRARLSNLEATPKPDEEVGSGCPKFSGTKMSLSVVGSIAVAEQLLEFSCMNMHCQQPCQGYSGSCQV